jgi:hypothetical protein
MKITRYHLRRTIRKLILIREGNEQSVDDLDASTLQKEKLGIIQKMQDGPLSGEDLQRLMRVNTLENELKVKKAEEEIKKSGKEFDDKMAKKYEEHQEKLAKRQSADEEKYIARQKEYDEFLQKFQKFISDQQK